MMRKTLLEWDMTLFLLLASSNNNNLLLLILSRLQLTSSTGILTECFHSQQKDETIAFVRI